LCAWSDVANTTSDSAAASCDDVRQTSATHPALYLLIFARMLNGLGNSGTTVLSVAYIDENISKTKSPLYIGNDCGPFSAGANSELEKLSSSRIEVRPTALPRSILTYDLDLQSHASYGHDRSHTKLKFKGQWVQKTYWKQADEQTDTSDYFTFPASAVGKITKETRSLYYWQDVRNGDASRLLWGNFEVFRLAGATCCTKGRNL